VSDRGSAPAIRLPLQESSLLPGSGARRVSGKRWGRVPRCAALAVILLSALIAYLPAIRGGFIWDDDAYVTDNPNLEDTAGLRRIWLEPLSSPQYYPMVFTTFWVEHRLWRLDPAGYHTVNVLLHAINGLLLWLVLERLKVPGALFGALLFVLHPVHVESVAWITERKNVLSAAFALASLLMFLRWAGPGAFTEAGEAVPGRSPRRTYAIALGLFALGLLSKTVVVTLPVIMLLILWWKSPRVKVRDLPPLLPFLALGLAMAALTVWLERTHVYAQGEDYSFVLSERFLIAGRAFWFYLGKLLWPVNLSFIYPRWDVKGPTGWTFLYPVAALAAVVALWRARMRARAPLVAIAGFLITVLPALGFINFFPMRYSFVADHFQYLASIGPLAIFGAGWWLARTRLATLAGRLGSCAPRFVTAAHSGLTVALLASLAILTWRQGGIYRDVESLWRDTLAKNPGAWISYNNLGNQLKRTQRIDEAIEIYRQGIERAPEGGPMLQLNLGTAYRSIGRSEEALAAYQAALSTRPRFTQALLALGTLLEDLGRHAEAIEVLTRARSLAPQEARIHIALGRALLGAGRPAAAVQSLELALRLRPDSTEARVELARASRALTPPPVIRVPER